VRRLPQFEEVKDESSEGPDRSRDRVGGPRRTSRVRFVARSLVLVGALTLIPAFFLPGTYPMNPRLDPRIWYAVGGDWLGIGIAIIALGILVGAYARHFESRRPS
jgi:hypothetical protein